MSSVIRSFNRSSIFCGGANGLLGVSLSAGGNGGIGFGGGGGGGGVSDGVGGSGETFTGTGANDLSVAGDGVDVLDRSIAVVFVRWANAGFVNAKTIVIATKTFFIIINY